MKLESTLTERWTDFRWPTRIIITTFVYKGCRESIKNWKKNQLNLKITHMSDGFL